MKNEQNEIEIISSFKEGNVNYIVKQPKKERSKDEMKAFYTALGNILYRTKP
jgi:hypothetical protein